MIAPAGFNFELYRAYLHRALRPGIGLLSHFGVDLDPRIRYAGTRCAYSGSGNLCFASAKAYGYFRHFQCDNISLLSAKHLVSLETASGSLEYISPTGRTSTGKR
jgi:hypothetical protein